jgi:hypothetical protein
MNDKTRNLFFLLLLAGMAMLHGCSSLPQFASEKRINPIVIDGDNNDWKNVSAYIDKNNTIAVRVCHDSEYFYFCLSSQDPQVQMQIINLGLTIWLDNEGSDHKKFGINFPLGIQAGGPPPMMDMDREKMKDQESMQRMMDQVCSQMEIVGKEIEDRYRLSVVNTEGIKVKIGRTKEEILVYELQAPLKRTAQHPHAIDIQDGASVGLGIETAEMKFPMGKISGGTPGGPGGSGEMGFGSPPGGGSLGMSQGGHPGSGMPPGGPPGGKRTLESVKMWWKVKL